MATRSLSALIKDADTIIEKRGGGQQVKTASVKEDDIFKLAEQIRTSRPEVSIEVPNDVVTLVEKIAHAVCLVDTMLNLDTLSKIDKLEKVAKEKGMTDDQISKWFEKKAGQNLKLKSVLHLMPWAK
jgi:hypothetical protein